MTEPAPRSNQLAKRLGTLRLGLGTVQFGLPYGVSNTAGQVGEDEARTIVARGLDAGLRVIDTAAAYGTSEEVLARALPTDRSVEAGQDLRIVTKTWPFRDSGGLAATVARLDQSFASFPAVDTVLVHAAAELSHGDGPALWAHLQRMQSEGRCRRIGISAYAQDGPLALARTFRPDVMQVPVSLLDQRLVADGTLTRLFDLGVEVHVRSLFLQGLLFLVQGSLPVKLAHAAPLLVRRHAMLSEAGVSPLQAALGFALALEEISVGIVGVTTVAELVAIVAAAEAPIPSGLDWRAFAVDDPIVLDPSAW